jgi:hypothetical protein
MLLKPTPFISLQLKLSLAETGEYDKKSILTVAAVRATPTTRSMVEDKTYFDLIAFLLSNILTVIR